jgi:hypothetical protein
VMIVKFSTKWNNNSVIGHCELKLHSWKLCNECVRLL